MRHSSILDDAYALVTYHLMIDRLDGARRKERLCAGLPLTAPSP